MDVLIREVTPSDIPAYAALIRSVYDEFVAPDYPEEGNRTFYDFIDEAACRARLDAGNFMICAEADGKIVGAHEVRNGNHISLFFVAKEFHGRGIGRMLFEEARFRIDLAQPDVTEITVHSSPYAVTVYERLGFEKTGPLEQRSGIIFQPMAYSLI